MKVSARAVRTDHYPVVTGDGMFASLEKALQRYQKQGRPVFLLTDTHVATHCIPVFYSRCPAIREAVVLQVDAGEEYKSLSSAEKLFKHLASYRAGRDALLVNLGGGMVSDLGGFVAATYHRGIDTMHIPTTLVAQVDASIGGKTAVNLDHVKNQVGAFYSPVGVYIWPGFLGTLPVGQLRAGLAEAAKSAIVRDASFWRWLSCRGVGEILSLPVDDPFWLNLIHHVLRVKLEIVRHDPFERRQRKLLNFGHTIGHALESYALGHGKPVLHGEAVAAGMVCETALSVARLALDPAEGMAISRWITDGFEPVRFLSRDEDELLALMRRDKKNRGSVIRFTLLTRIGQGKINQECSGESIRVALQQYQSF